MILDDLGINQCRFSVQWVSAAEGIRFVQVITEFDNTIKNIGRLGEKEGLDLTVLRRKLRAAEMTLRGRALRMVFAKQAKQVKDGFTYGKFPSKKKLFEAFRREMSLHETLLYLKEGDRTVVELGKLLDITEEQVVSNIDVLRKKNMWNDVINKQ